MSLDFYIITKRTQGKVMRLLAGPISNLEEARMKYNSLGTELKRHCDLLKVSIGDKAFGHTRPLTDAEIDNAITSKDSFNESIKPNRAFEARPLHARAKKRRKP